MLNQTRQENPLPEWVIAEYRALLARHNGERTEKFYEDLVSLKMNMHKRGRMQSRERRRKEHK